MKPKLVILISLMGFIVTAHAESTSLQDISRATEPLPQMTIYRAKEVITLDPAKPTAEAVAVVGDRILAVGTVDDLKGRTGDQPYTMDDTFANKVIVPGFIAQHDHPFLTALTMTSEIIAIEDWVLPGGTVPAPEGSRGQAHRSEGAAGHLGFPSLLLRQTDPRRPGQDQQGTSHPRVAPFLP